MGLLKAIVNGIGDFFKILVGGLLGAVLGIFGLKSGPALTPEPFKGELPKAAQVAKAELTAPAKTAQAKLAPSEPTKPVAAPKAELPKAETPKAEPAGSAVPKLEPAKAELAKAEAAKPKPAPEPVKPKVVEPAVPAASFDPAAIATPRPSRRPGAGMDYYRNLAKQVNS
ncbi:hypothetical protein [Leptolyngbya sp. FACHB-261]|uniref:hypothetical protein n=1 Tax=Leptolyngbya sp. FACHB-261 TaxID=2692806 RepID=UPI0016858CAE|nr:hypothetical protein [Leptolyngbya sp. FACHB-261]MBD2099332.1 hypothetical protein [Leptolyngbya sp. FACHB-261]